MFYCELVAKIGSMVLIRRDEHNMLKAQQVLYRTALLS